MEKRNNKIKEWFEENKEEIKHEVSKFVWYACGFGVGCFITKKISDYKFALGLNELRREGVLKFVNPTTGVEVGIAEAAQIVKTIDI